MQKDKDLKLAENGYLRGQSRGYVVNLMETCDKENEMKLFTKVQVEKAPAKTGMEEAVKVHYVAGRSEPLRPRVMRRLPV